MVNSVVDEDQAPRRRKPLLGGAGWLLFVCLFLPTLRVCGDPMMPAQFPPTYVAYLGAAALGALALATTLKVRRVWYTTWFLLWYATAVGWLAALMGSGVAAAGWIVAAIGLGCAFAIAPAFHRRRFTERAFWIGGIIQGVGALAWCLILAGDHDAMWGAYVAVAGAAGLLIASLFAAQQASAERAAQRRAREPAALPVARVVER